MNDLSSGTLFLLGVTTAIVLLALGAAIGSRSNRFWPLTPQMQRIAPLRWLGNFRHAVEAVAFVAACGGLFVFLFGKPAN